MGLQPLDMKSSMVVLRGSISNMLRDIGQLVDGDKDASLQSLFGKWGAAADACGEADGFQQSAPMSSWVFLAAMYLFDVMICLIDLDTLAVVDMFTDAKTVLLAKTPTTNLALKMWFQKVTARPIVWVRVSPWCVCACARACVSVCLFVFVCVCVCVFITCTGAYIITDSIHSACYASS